MPTVDEIQTTWRAAVDALLAQSAAERRDAIAQRDSVTQQLAEATNKLATATQQLQQDQVQITDLMAQLKALTPFTIDLTQPTLDNVGIPKGTTLKQLQGDITITQAGTVLDGVDVFGRIIVKAPDVTLRRGRARGAGDRTGTVVTYSQAVVSANNAAAMNLRIEDFEIIPDVSHPLVDGLQGHDYRLTRSVIRYTTDGCGWWPVNAGDAVTNEVEGSYIGDQVFWTGARGVVHPSDTKTHNDCIQIQGGIGGRIHGNTLYSYFAPKTLGRGTCDYPDNRANACVQYNNNRGDMGKAEVHHNWLYGGQSHLNIPMKAGQDVGSVHHNYAKGDSRLAKVALIPMQPSPSTTVLPVIDWHDNVMMSDGKTLATVARG